MKNKIKLLEDVAIQTPNGIEMISEGTVISELWNLDTGEEEIPGQEKQDPRKLKMLEIIDNFTQNLDDAKRMRYTEILGAAHDAIESGKLSKLKKIASFMVNRNKSEEVELTNTLRQLVSLGAFLNESVLELIPENVINEVWKLEDEEEESETFDDFSVGMSPKDIHQAVKILLGKVPKGIISAIQDKMADGHDFSHAVSMWLMNKKKDATEREMVKLGEEIEKLLTGVI